MVVSNAPEDERLPTVVARVQDSPQLIAVVNECIGLVDDQGRLPLIDDSEERARVVEQDLMVIREAAEEQIKSDLEAEVGIAQVLIKGGREEEIQVQVDSERLKNLGLTVDQVVTVLAEENVNLSGGRLKDGEAEYLVRTLNEFENIEEIRATILSNSTGEQFRLDDVADVHMGFKERKSIVRVGGQEAVELEFYKEGDANVVQVCNKLKDFFGFERKTNFQERILRLTRRRLIRRLCSFRLWNRILFFSVFMCVLRNL